MTRASARIDLGAVQRNCARLKEEVGEGVELCAVVKADGYGHGADACADAALAGGATRLAVATAAEAERIGHALPHVPLLTMGALTPEELDIALGAGSEIAVWREGFLGPGGRAGAGLGAPGERPRQARQRHGPARQPRPGAGDRDRPRLRRERGPRAGRHLDPFRDRRRTRLRLLRRPARAVRRSSPTRSAASSPRSIVHAANSAAVLRDRRSHFDMVRCGVAIYGLDPFQADPAERGLAPALSLSSYVADVKRFAAGDSAGYGRTWRAPADTNVGVLPLGYGDGVRRGLSNNAEVLVRGRRHPLVGTVSMDNLTIDLGPETEVEPGDEAVLIGCQGDESILAEEVAGRLDTINYEVTCGISARVPRIDPSDALAIASPRRRWSRSRARRWPVASRPGSPAARSATRPSAARSPTSIWPWPETPPPRRGRSPTRGDGHAFELSAEFATWRAVARDGAWQVDLTALRGETIEADLDARDFTLGAVAVPLEGGDPIDPHGGLADLERRILRVVDDGSFAADPLRLLRAARIAAELGLEIDPGTRALARAEAARAAEPAGERQLAELRQLIAGPDPLRGVELLDDLGLTAAVLPELDALRGVEQGPNHHLDVHGHTIAVLEQTLAVEADLDRFAGERAERGRRAARRAARRRVQPRAALRLRRPSARHRQAADAGRAERLRHLHRPRQRRRGDGLGDLLAPAGQPGADRPPAGADPAPPAARLPRPRGAAAAAPRPRVPARDRAGRRRRHAADRRRPPLGPRRRPVRDRGGDRGSPEPRPRDAGGGARLAPRRPARAALARRRARGRARDRSPGPSWARCWPSSRRPSTRAR